MHYFPGNLRSEVLFERMVSIVPPVHSALALAFVLSFKIKLNISGQ